MAQGTKWAIATGHHDTIVTVGTNTGLGTVSQDFRPLFLGSKTLPGPQMKRFKRLHELFCLTQKYSIAKYEFFTTIFCMSNMLNYFRITSTHIFIVSILRQYLHAPKMFSAVSVTSLSYKLELSIRISLRNRSHIQKSCNMSVRSQDGFCENKWELKNRVTLSL